MNDAEDWTAAYDNRAAVRGAEAMLDGWRVAAAAYRGAHPPERLPSGAHPRQGVDLWRPDGPARGLACYVHGGYWRIGAAQEYAHLAKAPLAAGWVAAIIGYRLCPEVRIADIVADIAAGLTAAAAAAEGPIRLAGHSAGGHLATRMLCPGVLSAETLRRLERVVSISGLHDLRPLLRTAMNADLRLDLAEARAESPALMEPLGGAEIHVWAGGAELPELRRQARILAEIWGGIGADIRWAEAAGEDHFTVVERLGEAGTGLHAAWLGG